MAVTIPDIIEETLAAASPEALLKTFASLTHQIHAAGKVRRPEHDASPRLRAQRDMVKAEILRRMGGTR